MATRTRYLHLSSKHRLETTTSKADLKIHLHTPIKNVVRCAVKQFSLANAGYNIRTGENVLSWVEFYSATGASGTFQYKQFEVVIPVGYYTAVELCAKINTEIPIQNPDRRVDLTNATEVVPTMTFTQNATGFHIELNFTYTSPPAGSEKFFAPMGDKISLWRQLGFNDGQFINILKRKRKGQFTDITEILHGSSYVVAYPQVVDVAVEGAIIGVFPATIESPVGIYLTSDVLTSGGTYETRTNPDSLALEARPEAIMEFIQFNTDRYSYVHYNAQQPHYHHLNQTSLHDIDIQLRSENGVVLNHNEIGEYNLVLVFECLVEPEYTPEFVKAYNDEGYRMAHQPERIIGLKN